jgi:hypothetical protein
VTTLAGSATFSTANGVGAAAGFNCPANVAVDVSGALLFVADFANRLIRQIVIATQTVATLAGSGTAASSNGVGTVAQFTSPRGLTVDSNGNLFVSEGSVGLIRKIVIATQTVTTVAGTGTSSAWADGFGTSAAFYRPFGLATDARGNILVAEVMNNRVRVLQPTVPCPAGMYCAPGTEAVACTSGYFCALGADRVACATGFYCPSGSTSPTQVACPAGAFHCAAGAAAPVSIACAAGYDCCSNNLCTCTIARMRFAQQFYFSLSCHW